MHQSLALILLTELLDNVVGVVAAAFVGERVGLVPVADDWPTVVAIEDKSEAELKLVGVYMPMISYRRARETLTEDSPQESDHRM